MKWGLHIHDYGAYTGGTNNRLPHLRGRGLRALWPAANVSVASSACGTGVGISLAANKIRGIRCVVCSDPYSAMLSRQHNDTNMLSMGARVVGTELAKMIARIWLTTEFEGGRHQRRVEQIAALERGENIE